MDQGVLILGNGISRLLHEGFVERWPGELWACNYAFRDFGPRLARLTGHVEILLEAVIEREKKGWTFETWGGNLGLSAAIDKVMTCPREFWKDSGTTLVAQALHEKRRVWVAGFDLGGVDVYSPGLENHNKSCWVERWRRIAAQWGLDHVTFVGHDHKPFILSNESSTEYQKHYTAGRPHMGDEAYLKLWSGWTGKEPEYFDATTRVRVRWLTGPTPGKTELFRADIARHLVRKHQAELVEEAKV